MMRNSRNEQNDGDRKMCDEWKDETENWVQNEMMNGDNSWNNRVGYRNWIQNKLTDGHNTWSRNWQNDLVRDNFTSHSIESVGQAVGVRSDRRCRQIAFGIDTAACRTVVPARHPATRGRGGGGEGGKRREKERVKWEGEGKTRGMCVRPGVNERLSCTINQSKILGQLSIE